MLKYLTVPVTPFQQNCSIVWAEPTRQAAIIAENLMAMAQIDTPSDTPARWPFVQPRANRPNLGSWNADPRASRRG